MIMVVFSGIWYVFFVDKSMLVDYDIRRFKNKKLRDNHEKLIVIALLDYEHYFMKNLHTTVSHKLKFYILI